MSKIKFAYSYPFVCFFFLLPFSGCYRNSTLPDKPENEKTIYTTIDGTWRSTDETVLKLPNGILEPVISITGSIENQLHIRGCFMWDSKYYNEWPLVEYHYNNSQGQIYIKDAEGSFYIGTVNHEFSKISGTVYSGNPENPVVEDQLDLIRTSEQMTNRLFYPRAPNPDGSITYTYQIPEPINDDLKTASVFSQTDTSSIYTLIKKIINQEWGRLESLLIVKDDQLVVEEYFYGYDRDQLHNIHSCTKSVVSLLFGMVLEKHPEVTLDQPVFDFFPEYDSLKNSENKMITLKHLLTMTAGFQPNSDLEDFMPEDLYHHILNSPIGRVPGSEFEYSNESTELIGGIIQALEGKHADEIARESLFKTLGINHYFWKRVNERPYCFAHLEMLPRDMAKIGLLVLNKGKWKGKQVIPESWIIESTTPHVSESESFDYGYQWWFRSEKNNPWWSNSDNRVTTENELITALGYGGQFIMIIRDLNLVVVTTASDYNEGTGKWISKIPMVVEEIAPLFEKD